MDLSALKSILVENLTQRQPGDPQVLVSVHQHGAIQALVSYASIHRKAPQPIANICERQNRCLVNRGM